MTQSIDFHLSSSVSEGRKQFTSIYYTVSEAIDALGYGSYQLLISVWLGIVMCSFTIENCLVLELPFQLACYWEGLNHASGLIVISLMKCTSPLWGYAADCYGRKPPIIISVLVQLLLITFIVNVSIGTTLFMMFQLLIASFQEALLIMFALLVEYSPSTSRVQSVMFSEIFCFVGRIAAILYSYLMGGYINAGRNMLLVSAIPLLSIFILTCYWFPDSALFLSKNGKEEAVGGQINSIAKLNVKKDVLNRIQITNVIRTDEKRKDPCFEFFRLALGHGHFYTTFVTWSLWFLNGIAYNGITFATPTIVKGSESCYTDKIETFGVLGEENGPCDLVDSSDFQDIALNTAAEFPAILIGAILIDVFGRRGTIVSCTSLYLVCLAPIIISYCEISQTAITIFLFIARGAAMIWFMTNLVFTLEQYSTKTRCTGLGIGYCFMQLGSVISILIRNYVISYSITLSVFVFFSIGVFGFLLAIYMPAFEITKDLSSIGEVTIEESEAISIEYIPSKSIEIRRKNVGRKRVDIT